MKKLLVLLAATAALVFAGTAQAGPIFNVNPRVDAIGRDISGIYDMFVVGIDGWNAWAYVSKANDPSAVMGFVNIYAPRSSDRYHNIYISPAYWPALLGATLNGPANSGYDRYTTAKAIFTLTHEAYHYRLFSGDEGRVNACALQAFPGVLTREFGVQPTVTTSGVIRKKVPAQYRVRYHHRWVYRYRWKTVWRTVTKTSPNPVFQEFVADVQDFYTNHQSPPYNTGTCY
jgi:hypothetical protein